MVKLHPSMVTYDRGSGVVNLRLRKRHPGEKPFKTREVAPWWVVDFDADEKPYYIEVICPSKCFPKAVLDILPPEFIKDVTKPAKKSAKKHSR